MRVCFAGFTAPSHNESRRRPKTATHAFIRCPFPCAFVTMWNAWFKYVYTLEMPSVIPGASHDRWIIEKLQPNPALRVFHSPFSAFLYLQGRIIIAPSVLLSVRLPISHAPPNTLLPSFVFEVANLL